MEIKLTSKERQIMEILWNSEEPLSSSDIFDIGGNLNRNTLQAALRNLRKREYIRIAGVRETRTILGKLYEPIIKQEDFLKSSVSQKSLKNLISNFVSGESDLETLDQIEEMILKRKKQLEKK